MRKRLYIPNYKKEKAYNKRPWIKVVLGVLLVVALFVCSFLIAYNYKTSIAGNKPTDISDKKDISIMSKDELIKKVNDLQSQITQKEQKINEITSEMQKYKNVVDSLNKIGDTQSSGINPIPQNTIKPTLAPTIKPEQKTTAAPNVTEQPASTNYPDTTSTTTQKSVYGN